MANPDLPKSDPAEKTGAETKIKLQKILRAIEPALTGNRSSESVKLELNLLADKIRGLFLPGQLPAAWDKLARILRSNDLFFDQDEIKNQNYADRLDEAIEDAEKFI